uniref:Gag-pol polyprotein n=1 Tax=Syphacia muris TaxID=451379 RepID=A0A0N5ABA7_9BILA
MQQLNSEKLEAEEKRYNKVAIEDGILEAMEDARDLILKLKFKMDSERECVKDTRTKNSSRVRKESEDEDENEEGVTGSGKGKYTKLPHLKILTFKGDPTEWPGI